MNVMGRVLLATPLYRSFRRFGWPKMLPMNVTVLISTRCNSRCKTCNIWKQVKDDFTMDEWRKVLSSIGRVPYWFTISGGEPFLQPHVADLAIEIYRRCEPGVINIPTNSLLVDKIQKDVEKILRHCPGMNLVINLSLDGVGEKHDEIRGVKGSFERVMRNFKNLMKLKKRYHNLTVGFHSVVSKFSVAHIPQLADFCWKLKPDQYITEIAEQRVELDTVGMDITPEYSKYKNAIDYVMNTMKKEPFRGFAKITRAFRLEYYEFVKKWLRGEKTGIVDYAGWSSCEISSWGEVWPSCIGGINLGNLRDAEYDFSKIWFGNMASRVRKKLKKKEESFPLANAFYSNALCNWRTLFYVCWALLRR